MKTDVTVTTEIVFVMRDVVEVTREMIRVRFKQMVEDAGGLDAWLAAQTWHGVPEKRQ